MAMRDLAPKITLLEILFGKNSSSIFNKQGGENLTCDME